jgi:hypothetical protein
MVAATSSVSDGCALPPAASWVGSRVRYLEEALDEADLSFIAETYAFKNVICELRQGFGRRFNGTGPFSNGRQRRSLITHPDGVNLHDPSTIRRHAGVDRLNQPAAHEHLYGMGRPHPPMGWVGQSPSVSKPPTTGLFLAQFSLA